MIAGSSTTSVKTAPSSYTNSYYDGAALQIVDGIHSMVRQISYYHSDGTFYLMQPLPFVPSVGSKIYVLAAHRPDLKGSIA